MRHLIRRPITWMVAAEIVVVAALVLASWYFLTGARPPSDLPALLLPSSSPPSDAMASVPPDALAPPAPSGVPLLPGLNVDPAFWRSRLEALNGAQAQFEELEWRIVHSAMDSMRRYIETVVLPSIERAESGGRRM
ncbi:MAG TPA: hypothetical protein VGV88_08450 [Candidatus Dormibacteraeota bacterium]|nr:hypothetical protein [Candidatus Dormibacteraeota bacterium]